MQTIKLENLEKYLQNNNTSNIISDDIKEVIKQKFAILLNIYHQNCYQNGYNPNIAFRIIIFYFYAEVKNQFNVLEQVNRFINHQTITHQLENIQKCMDLLLLKNLQLKVSDRQMKLWRVLVLQSLKIYYKENGKKKQKKKVSRTIRIICHQILKKSQIKTDFEMYAKFLDILIAEERYTMESLTRRGKIFEAIQFANNIIRAIQKAQQSLLSKYQQQLMLAYWDVAQLHYRLHYIAHSKKYCQISMNIAERINNKTYMNQMKKMLQQLNF